MAERLADRFWPGPLTLVVEAIPGLPPEIAGSGTVGVRVPGNEAARRLSRLAGGPITSTSANLSGGAPVSRPGNLAPAVAAALDALLDGGDTPGGSPSTVVAVAGARLELLRAGAVRWEAVEAAARADAPLPGPND